MADFLPGIVVDKFADVLVVQSLAMGIDRWKEVIIEKCRLVLEEYGMKVRGVYERSAKNQTAAFYIHHLFPIFNRLSHPLF